MFAEVGNLAPVFVGSIFSHPGNHLSIFSDWMWHKLMETRLTHLLQSFLQKAADAAAVKLNQPAADVLYYYTFFFYLLQFLKWKNVLPKNSFVSVSNIILQILDLVDQYCILSIHQESLIVFKDLTSLFWYLNWINLP